MLGETPLKIDPRIYGKIIRVAMVGFFGLLLAYYDYGQRGPRTRESGRVNTEQ